MIGKLSYKRINIQNFKIYRARKRKKQNQHVPLTLFAGRICNPRMASRPSLVEWIDILLYKNNDIIINNYKN